MTAWLVFANFTFDEEPILTGIYDTEINAIAFIKKAYSRFEEFTNTNEWVDEDGNVVFCREVSMNSNMFNGWKNRE